MSEQNLGSAPIPPRSASGRSRAKAEDPTAPLTPEGSPKPPLPESAEFLMNETAEPNVVKDGEAEAEAATPTPGFDFAAFGAEQQAQLERLSANLARAALAAQGAIGEATLRQADRPAGASPDPFNVIPALTDVMGRLAAQPDRLMQAQADLFNRYMDLWHSTVRKMAGAPAILRTVECHRSM